MTPRLLNSNADNFTRLGYGPLNNCISCTVTEELGEAPTLELEVLISDPLLPFIQVGNIISAAPNKRDEPQAFVIEEISKPLDGIITVYAPHIAQHRGKLIPVRPTYAGTLDNSLNNIIANVMETNPFTIKRDPSKENVSASWEITAPRSLRECLGGREGSIVDVFGGEWKYDNYTLTLYNHIGRDNGVRVLYGRNMTDFELEEEFNWTSSVTGCVGFWTGENDSGTETTVYGNVIHSDLAGNFPYNKTVVVDFSGIWDSPPSVATIDQAASEWIRGKGQVGATAKVAFNHLEVENGGDVGLGDTIHVYNNEYGYDMESRIVGTEYDVLQEEYLSVTIGDKQTTLTEAIQGTVDVDTSASGGGSGPSVEPSYTMPLMDGTAAIGTETKYARGDHVHPTDTTRLSTAEAANIYVQKLGTRLTGNVPNGTSLADYCRTTNVPNGLSFWGIQNASDNPRPGIVGTALVYKPISSGQYTVPLIFSSGKTFISTQLGATGGFTWRPVTGNTDNLQCTGESNITFTLNQAQKNGNVAIIALDFKSSTAKSAWTATGVTVPTDMRPNASRNIYVATNIGGSLAFTQWQVLDTGVIRLSRSMGANVQHTVTLIYLI